MKPGDLYRVRTGVGAHPDEYFLNGSLALVIGEPTRAPGNPRLEFVRCLCDRVRMVPTRWLEWGGRVP